MRCDFVMGLDYRDSIEEAQKLILELLAKSELVLKDPEPWVLVDELGGSAISLRIYFWLNARDLSTYKVTSHLMLDAKNLLLGLGFRFPDPAREIVFTNELITTWDTNYRKGQVTKSVASRPPRPEEVRSEAIELNRQALESDLPDQGENIL